MNTLKMPVLQISPEYLAALERYCQLLQKLREVQSTLEEGMRHNRIRFVSLPTISVDTIEEDVAEVLQCPACGSKEIKKETPCGTRLKCVCGQWYRSNVAAEYGLPPGEAC
jgi:hypothetical protein